jgi:diaminohydroxyphosphoribosylaminopyrimidine deaminase/5-amino-6-(5-phosphoribosylamino)uracil reductase
MDAALIDRAMMRHALVLARRGLGRTWPNPTVGAVIWQMDGDQPIIVGRGFTQPGGRPHAETQAIAMAGESARGASMAVTLEPCAHHGKTPPCAEAIVAAGIVRVVSALEDPDPRVKGGGHAILRNAGLDVSIGVLAEEARAVNLGFLSKILDHRPMVTLKLAQTADGFAGVMGQQLMVSSSVSKQRVHLARAAHDAIMVGVGTVLADNPDLTCRLPGMMPFLPVRVVLDTHLATPLGCRLVETCDTVPTWIVTGPDTPNEKIEAFRKTGVIIERAALGKDGRIDIRDALKVLASRGLTRILSEGGPMLAEALARADVIDSVEIYTSPERLNREGIAALRPGLQAALGDASRFEVSHKVTSGRDTLVHYSRRG